MTETWNCSSRESASKAVLLSALMLSGLISRADVAEDSVALKDIVNFVQYSPLFASSGQPNAQQLKRVQQAGFDQVIYLAFTDNETAIANEDREVMSLGMDYVHIPVDFDRPTLEDFETFSTVMQKNTERKTLLHCQVNFRASTFSFLYRVIYLKVPLAKAKSALDNIWRTDEVWFRFLVGVLAQHGLTHECESCDWEEHEFLESPPEHGP